MSREAEASVASVKPSQLSPSSRVLVKLTMATEHAQYLREGQRITLVIPEPLPEQQDPVKVVAMTFCDPGWEPGDSEPDPCDRHLVLARQALRHI
mgnify:CR=1 FL=1